MNTRNYLTLLNIIITLAIAVILIRRNKIAFATHVALLAFVITVWSTIHLLYNLQLFYIPKLFFVSAVYFCETIAGTLLLIFALIYSDRTQWLNVGTIALLAIEPILTQILLWSETTRSTFFLESTSPDALLLQSGLWADINSIYIYACEITSLLLLTDVFSKRPRTLFYQSGIFLTVVFVPFLFRTVNMVGNTTWITAGLSIIAYSITVVGLTIGLHRNNIVEFEPVTFETAIKAMSDGWMILDLKNIIIDANPAVEKIIGMSRHSLYGRPIRSVLPDWPHISDMASEGRELEMRRSVRSLGTWRYLNVNLSVLRDPYGKPFGQLIIWHDITERKKAEEARQRARDEMFVLLNAISNAASHSIKLDDFLSESVYQLIYPFQSQMIALFLVDEYDNAEREKQLHLTAHFGLSPEDQDELDATLAQGQIFTNVLLNRQPFIVDDAQENTRVPPVFNQLSNLVVMPLLAQTGDSSRLLGMLAMGRKDGPTYSQDELIRLSTVAEQIANLIDSDRRRQLAIALSEREKLMRDLHDSVSQKLYGLLTLTEAAQAALEAGSKVIPSQVLSKIGDNARQAVKEMRLFLYQMQPVDLEKGSLVAALHHRLGAVEGRADIQARFLPDEGISMSKDKEVALYYIAQEALNNILKHAHANQVLVRLKQTRKNVILDVVDNGDGFDLKQVDHNGMGLQNMKTRATQIGGKLKITSKPRAGTTIKVVVGREKRSVQKSIR